MAASIARQVRECLADVLAIPDLLLLIDDFVLECSSSSTPQLLTLQLEEELQAIHHQSSLNVRETEVFLAVLYHLSPIWPVVSIISSWFDLLLRPALREPRLSTPAVNYAKDLVVGALSSSTYEEGEEGKVKDFRRRLMDLYLLDAFNEGSGEDVMESALLSEEEKEGRRCWKANLEDVLLRFGGQRPYVRFGVFLSLTCLWF